MKLLATLPLANRLLRWTSTAGLSAALLAGCTDSEESNSGGADDSCETCSDAGDSTGDRADGGDGAQAAPEDAGTADDGPDDDVELGPDAGRSSNGDRGGSADAGARQPDAGGDGPPMDPPVTFDDTVTQTDQLDLLLVVDNSVSMADKQEIFAAALPDMIGELVSPPCVSPEGEVVSKPMTADELCPVESVRQYRALSDIHVAIITTSLGGYGAVKDCVALEQYEYTAQQADMAHLLGSRPRGMVGGSDLTAAGFLKWAPGSTRAGFQQSFSDLLGTAGDQGCGWEASLESWYRFLIEPAPYQNIERVNCPFGGDTRQSCIGPSTDADGNPVVDLVLLEQRRQFLRPNSLLGIVMLTDENDCSFKASGQSWRLSQTVDENGLKFEAFKGTDTCASDPNSKCCHSCGASPPADCPSEVNDTGRTVGIGCVEEPKFLTDSGLDHPNLRCFHQKARFGVDYLYPVERYYRALTRPTLCANADDLDPAACADEDKVNNPLFSDLTFEQRLRQDPSAERLPPRDPSLIYLVGILGVPWQDVATDPSPSNSLVYRRTDAEGDQAINWSWLIGERYPASGIPEPVDPLMREQVEPRTGVTPATREALAGPDSSPMSNSINGHEWNVRDNSDLQYACIFPLRREQECMDPDEASELALQGVAVPGCDCTDFGAEPNEDPASSFNNPLCQAADGSYDRTQRYAKAYPSLRQLQVLHDLGDNSIVASICPKESRNTSAPDFGYRPVVEAMLERFRTHLGASY